MKKIIFLLAFPVLVNAQQKDTTTYVLKGKVEDFQLLYKSVAYPKDVTPNQQDAVAKWIEGIKPEQEKADTTH